MKPPVVSSAEYAGAISRWCDLHGHTPSVRPGEVKAAAEFEAFNAHLARLAAERRTARSLPPTRPPMRRS